MSEFFVCFSAFFMTILSSSYWYPSDVTSHARVTYFVAHLAVGVSTMLSTCQIQIFIYMAAKFFEFNIGWLILPLAFILFTSYGDVVRIRQHIHHPGPLYRISSF